MRAWIFSLTDSEVSMLAVTLVVVAIGGVGLLSCLLGWACRKCGLDGKEREEDDAA